MVMKRDTAMAIRFFLRYLTDNVPHRVTKTIVILNGKILITMDLIQGEIFLKKKYIYIYILREEFKVSRVNNKRTRTNIRRTTLNDFARPWKEVVRSTKT